MTTTCKTCGSKIAPTDAVCLYCAAIHKIDYYRYLNDLNRYKMELGYYKTKLDAFNQDIKEKIEATERLNAIDLNPFQFAEPAVKEAERLLTELKDEWPKREAEMKALMERVEAQSAEVMRQIEALKPELPEIELPEVPQFNPPEIEY